ncbi:thioredoxin domain-containing protein [Agreia bicolorata]|uniref:Spermatogenesis-associated protein 20-like TRX domain-containing protein n=1 Tax=Agreia bicolorata TaxID=110935 RepID=A0ABR5CJK7_9MICO|nr:thioredoxin domain-containing protein [Agreia bicolorata]KJC65807.1 hypothetical protein TZ00_03365 [Agreia bicolorata]
MANRLYDAISPYLRSHADNPVDWFPWGTEAFDEAARRDVPVLVSIGYSTCHWCHVMARESFSDPELAAQLNSRFVAIKVDREEHPEVDSVYLAAAGAFTQGLGWPLNVFVTPQGKAFFAGTYSPPTPVQGHPSFAQVLDAVDDAWQARRDQVDLTAEAISDALAQAAAATPRGALPADADARLAQAVRELEAYEDTTYGGFGGAPKFPVAPVLSMLLRRGSPLATRTLLAMSRSPLRDAIEGGFFRYSVNRDWSDPHYERMLYDNALLLDEYARVGASPDAATAESRETAEGIASFLTSVLQQPEGGFGSAQDSESTVAGSRSEGGYYALDAAGRALETPPAVDAKILTGWNGLAIAALARAGFALDRPDWIASATRAADYLLESHVSADGSLVRASIGSRRSDAAATLEDYGAFAGGLLALATVSGQVRYANSARRLIDSVLDAGFTAPGGRDSVLSAQNIAAAVDTAEGAYPSGISAVCSAALTLFDLTGEARYRDVVSQTIGGVAPEAFPRPIGYGATLELVQRLLEPTEQLVVVTPGTEADASDRLVDEARANTESLTVVVTETQAREWAEAGFGLLAGRAASNGRSTAYLCTDFVCRLPLTEPVDLELALRPV